MDEINLALNLPGDKVDYAISDGINKISEILGGETSDQWKEKMKRKEERERKDTNGKVFGYSDKGSLQYPMVNNIADDLDIIGKTWGQPRGYMTYTFSSYVNPQNA